VEQAPLYTGVADAGIGLIGEYVWVYGGTDAKGASTAVQVGHFGVPGSAPAPGASGAAASPGAAASAAAASPQASAATQASGIQQWATSGAFALPAARTAAGTFTGNGALYLVGGSDGTTVAKELYWAIPSGSGLITDGWKHTPVLDLGEGLSGGSGVVLGSAGVIIGGTTNSGVLASSVRTSLAPEEPFFQLGPVGVVVPALHIPGEIGQQLGYLSAAGASMTFFFLFVFLGWVWNNKPKVRAWWARRRGRAAA